MPIEIIELRLALAWGKSFDKATFLPYLANSARYQEEFDRAKAGGADWLLPWTEGEQQHFWQFYLRTSLLGDLNNVDAETAWNALMPLRAPRMVRLTTPKDIRITLEGYAFPHSVGVLAMMFFDPEKALPLRDMIDRVVEARKTHYSAIWEDKHQSHGELDSLADELIDVLHENLLGETPRGNLLSSPITTATVVNASLKELTPEDAVELDRAMVCLCDLAREPVDPATVVAYGGVMMDRMVAVQRGRAIWLPHHFSDPENRRPHVRAMGCYHRNLALASLQTRSLVGLLRRAEGFLPNEPVSGRLVQPVRKALRLLIDMQGGERTTYQSWALKKQIGFYRELIDRVLDAVRMH